MIFLALALAAPRDFEVTMALTDDTDVTEKVFR